jgi:ubiquinone/menaquinone biosynthesis C-methylase UbiE
MTQAMSQPHPSDVPDACRWNHNIHYHNLLLRHLPASPDNVIDIGCGDGVLVRQLAVHAKHVIGIDMDGNSILEARRLTSAPNANFIHGDALTYPFGDGTFDAVFSVAAIHHMVMREAIRKFVSLLRSGGTLGVIGIGRPQIARDFPWLLASIVMTRFYRVTKPHWEHPSPKCWPPPHTTTEARHIAVTELPGCQFRRLVLWRYSILWRKP